MKVIDKLGEVAYYLCERNRKLYTEFIRSLEEMWDQDFVIAVLEKSIEIGKERKKPDGVNNLTGESGGIEKSDHISQGERYDGDRKETEETIEQDTEGNQKSEKGTRGEAA